MVLRIRGETHISLPSARVGTITFSGKQNQPSNGPPRGGALERRFSAELLSNVGAKLLQQSVFVKNARKREDREGAQGNDCRRKRTAD